MLAKAIEIASQAHFYQKRKQSGLPYIVHPIEVMQFVHDNVSQDEFYLSVAVLHDVIEDCELYFNQEVARLSPDVHKAVLHLTKGKNLEETHDRLYSAPAMIQLIKVADIYSNTKTVLYPKYIHKKIIQMEHMADEAINHRFWEKTMWQLKGHLND